MHIRTEDLKIGQRIMVHAGVPALITDLVMRDWTKVVIIHYRREVDGRAFHTLKDKDVLTELITEDLQTRNEEEK